MNEQNFNNQSNNQSSSQNFQTQNGQTNNQANNQEVQKMVQQQNEMKTVMNGKVVPLQEVQVAEELFNQQNTSTGIQDHHDNSSEAVQSGQVAQNMQQAFSEAMTNLENAKSFMNQANVQSGQGHLESYMQQAQQEIQQAQQQIQRATANMQNQAGQKQQSKTQGMPEAVQQQMEDHEAIQNSISAKAKAKGKKD